MNRKELKTSARKTLRKHYRFLIIVCLVSSLIGSEFSSSITIAQVGAKKESDISIFEMSNTKQKFNTLKDEVEKQSSEIKDGKDLILNHKKSIFMSAVRVFTTGSIYAVVGRTVKSIINSYSLWMCILIIFAMAILLSLWYLMVNVYTVISRRMFLEARVYKRVRKTRYMYLQRTKTWLKVAKVMFLRYIYTLLWTLTIVGGIIKHFSYFMVPFIVAENPNIKAHDAINLSRKMMDGYKWEAFKLEFSFIGWNILGLFTLGLSSIFYSNAYEVATFSEFFVKLRKKAIKDKIEGYEYFNDEYLYEVAPKEQLDKEYKEKYDSCESEKHIIPTEKGVKGFLIKNFGLSLGKHEKEYEEELIRSTNYNYLTDCINGNIYPDSLFPSKNKPDKYKLDNLNYRRRYTIYNLILMFFIFSFIGWAWEVLLHIVEDGRFVNRGVMHGPWLPIYGAGSVLILLVLYRFRKDPGKHALLTAIICGVVEYYTALILELTHNGQRWWDYTGYFLNIDGRICADGILLFVIAGMSVVYFIAPHVDDLLRKGNKKVRITLCIILTIILAGDIVYSITKPNVGKGITDYEVSLKEKK